MVRWRPVAITAVLVLAVSACSHPPSGPTLAFGGARPASGTQSATATTPPRAPGWYSATPPPTKPTTMYWDVAALDATHAWSVGGGDGYSVDAPATTGHPLVAKWDGRQWTRMELPADWKATGVSLVAADSPTNVWIKGSPWITSPDANLTMLLRYDGSNWQQVAFPPGATPSSLTITGMAVVGGHTWLVGHEGVKTIIQEWDGQTWKAHQPPAECTQGGTSFAGMPNFCNLNSVTAFGPDDIWAAGNGAWAGFKGPLLLHWDGTGWQVVQVGSYNEEFTLVAVAGRSGTDVWAAGHINMGGKQLVVHSDGKSWQAFRDLPDAVMTDLTVDADGQPWLIRTYPPASTTTFTTYADGKWTDTLVPTPNGASGVSMKAVTAIPRTRHLLAVGGVDLPTNPVTIQAHFMDYVGKP
ncbi:MAG TPA: hypothetical protein VFV67_10530 [Actinophytocola sp.]|uniref:hypothetical protein n=1 Tax=Actinophytocola sp. TaxID=1872138 RepID=UPI002DB791DF|nr:hypothetical protein [Actinophytocola sp.]HEU5471079.1 hypothetical protein [Actinophytocola sp.]